MSCTELPKLGQARIANGTFVIFSFDPVTYASAIDPADNALSAAARRIKRKKYLGLVQGPGPIDVPNLRQNLNIRVVGLAPPQEGEDDVYPTNPSRCVPVHPATAHPEGREPLRPSAPLPWEGCYVHTLQLINAFVSRVHHANPTDATITITKEELRRLSRLVVDDEYAAAEAQEALARDESDSHNDEINSHSDVESEWSSHSGEGDGSDLDSSELVDPEMLAPSKPYMEIWDDLTVATTLGEPKDVGADVDEIMDIGEEWEQRKKHERRANPATLQWAEQLARLSAKDFVPNSGAAEVVEDTCDELAPEDAVDERQQPKRDAEPEHSQARSDPDRAAPAQLNEFPDNLSVERPTTGACLDGDGSSLFVVLRHWIQLLLHL